MLSRGEIVWPRDPQLTGPTGERAGFGKPKSFLGHPQNPILPEINLLFERHGCGPWPASSHPRLPLR